METCNAQVASITESGKSSMEPFVLKRKMRRGPYRNDA